MHSLGWALLHFLWQGTAVAALAAVVMAFCRRASARYAVAVGALVIMLAAPVATFFSVARSRAVLPESSYSFVTQSAASTSATARHSSSMARLSPSLDALPWLVEAWLLGVAFFSLRSAGGFLLLERERRRQSATVSDRVLALCHALQQRLGLERTIQYCECRWLQAPAVIGWFRPIVLLPLTALTGLSDEQLQSIIAHELAHIQRFDAFVNVFQIAVETLLFYHPAVWWLNKRIRAEREHCCDDVAVSLCGNPVEYARALTLMEEWRSAPALAMAANRGPLSERIFRVLGLKSIVDGKRGLGVAGGILCLTAALVAGNALLGIAYPKMHAGAVSAARVSLGHFGWAAGDSSQSTPAAAPAKAAASPAAKPSPARPQAAAHPATGATPAGSYIDGMKAAVGGDLTVDELIAMKIQGATPEYVHELRGLGLNPNADETVAMKIQGVSPDYVRGLKDAGIQSDVDQLIAMKIQGVTPDYVRGLHEQGLQPDANELVAMRIQGVTPEYVRDIRALGLKPNADEFVSMRVQSVTPEYIKAMQAAGFKFDVDGILAAKVQGVTPEFVEKARKHGFQNLSIDKLIQLKRLGILESPADL
jgi:beta-lactamase regulating signal transducer with metallopeptidase domain